MLHTMMCHVQVMLHELLAKTWGRSGFESFIKRLQAQYARQAAVAEEAAEQQLAGLAEWQPARAGMFMWFRLTGEPLCLATFCVHVQDRFGSQHMGPHSPLCVYGVGNRMPLCPGSA
jgi:DNA-binding transcriptional MocR family regulator